MRTINKIMMAAAVASLAALGSQAQQSATCDGATMFETVSKIEKKTDKFNLYFNMHGDFEGNWTDGTFDGAKFQMKQFRLEAKGNINSWLSYRYRQRLTKTQEPGATDNLAQAIDIAGIGVKLDKWGFFLGKQCAAYGGIEFDLNPIEIYQYSDMVDYMSNFMTGVNIAYNATPTQQFQFQILDALTGTSQAMYGSWAPTKMPFVYTLNWNGNNFGGIWNTRWSASMMNEVKGKKMWYFALGNDFRITDRFGAYFDWMYSREGVDRKGIMTSIVGQTPFGGNCTDAVYNSFILHLNYKITPAWNVFCKLMYEAEGISKDDTALGIEKGKYRTALGYIAGVEYYPLKDGNLHFFATYVGRDYKYTDRAKAFGQADYDTNRFSLGFIWQMPVF